MNTQDFGTMYEALLTDPTAFLQTAGFPILLGAVVVLVLLAFFSYRLFRISLSISGTVGGGFSFASLLNKNNGQTKLEQYCKDKNARIVTFGQREDDLSDT